MQNNIFNHLFNIIIISLPFIALLGFIDKTKNEKIFKTIKGIVIWIFITPFLVLAISSFGDNISINYLNGWLQFLIGCFLIDFYKFPRSLVFFALFVPGLSNLYFLIYGPIKNLNNQK